MDTEPLDLSPILSIIMSALAFVEMIGGHREASALYWVAAAIFSKRLL